MLEEADQCSEGESAFPGLITQDREENSILRRIIGANKGKARRSRSFIRAQQEAIDLVLDPGLPEVFKVKEEPENGSQLKSLHFANMQRMCSEISKHRLSRSLSHDLYKPDNKAICVKGVNDGEFLEKEQLGEVNDEVSAEVTQGVDGRPLKSLHWRALDQRHNCNGNSCEKCKRVLEVKKAVDRFEAIRAAKQVLQESRSNEKTEDEDSNEFGESLQKIKREERFCRNMALAPNARTRVQKSKTPAAQDVRRVHSGGNCKWAQPVLSEMPTGVHKERAFNNNSRSSTPKPEEGDLVLERERRSSLTCASKLKFIREYLDDEPDFESEEITSADLAPRSQTDIVFTLPCSYERRFARPKPLNPRIVLLDMACEEIDEKPASSFEKGGGITFFRKFITVKSLVRRYHSTESDSGCGRAIPNQDLDEKRAAS